MAQAWEALARAAQDWGIWFVRHYHRLVIEVGDIPRDRPLVFVANHGFGGIFDLNVFAVMAAIRDLHLGGPVTFLVHEIAWTLDVGPLLEPLGAVPATPETAREALARGDHVVVFPGGEIDASKPFNERNSIRFGGRQGFARLALDAGAPIVPVVTAGAGNSLFVVTSGRRIARWLRLDRSVRVKALPISVSIPWGISVGAAGMLPYFPLPAQLRSRVLAPVLPHDHLDAAQLADQVVATMQEALTDLAGMS